MIGKLKGRVDGVEEDHLILDVNGVGYLVHCSARTLSALPAAGEPTVLFIETYVREDQIRLFGFGTPGEREWFRLLQSVQGVGAKIALGVLSTLPPAALAEAVARGDKASIARAPGVGPRTALRIVTELKDKVGGLAFAGPVPADLGGAGVARGGPAADAVSALVNLGYGQPQAMAAVAAAARSAGDEASAETLIRLGLREMAK